MEQSTQQIPGKVNSAVSQILLKRGKFIGKPKWYFYEVKRTCKHNTIGIPTYHTVALKSSPAKSGHGLINEIVSCIGFL